MVMQPNLGGIPENPPSLVTLGQDKFDRGVITLIDQSKLPRNALKVADNMTLLEDGSPVPRMGVDWFGNAPTNSGNGIDGAAMHVNSTDDSVHLLCVSNGTVYRSVNDGVSWDACTGATLTAGKKCSFEQANDFTFIGNGWDNIVRYNGTTTLQTYTALTTPVGSSLTKTGLAGTVYTYRYRVSAVNDVGYTIASAALTIQTDRTRDTFDTTNFTTFTWGAIPGAVRYDIYVGQIAGEEYYIDSVEGNATTTYVDKGQAIEQTSLVAPDSNTTQGPRAADLTLVGTRLYATGDRDYPYRIWISGAGRFVGQFSSAYDATYLDWQKGGQFKPIKTEDYRDGKGNPLATIWCRSKDGLGCVLQGTLESFTVGDVTFPVPNFSRLPGSRGTDAPFGVVNVLNDYMYPNSQAIYNLGSRAQFLNLLSTDEASANIRPNIKRITKGQDYKICAHFQDAKVYISMPVNDSTTNNVTAMFDTERRAWLPRAFTIGFERFFSYTGTDGTRYMLAWKPGDKRLSQISENIRGDYGVAFSTELTTGLIHVNPKNRIGGWIWCEEGEVEFAQTRSQISIELSGITREEDFKSIRTVNIDAASTTYGWTNSAWTTHPWTYTTGAPVIISGPSLKRFFSVNEDINAYQYSIRTTSIDAYYILRTLQINGTDTQAGKPREWELFD